MTAKRLVGWVSTAALTLLAGAAAAQGVGGAGAGTARAPLLDQVISTIIFSLLGVGLAIAGFKLFDMAIKFDIEHEICEKNNLSAALLASSVVLGTCIIVAVVVLS